MGKGQVSIENGFVIVLHTWPFLHAFWKLKVYASPIRCYYCVAILLTNAINGSIPNQIAQCLIVSHLHSKIFTIDKTKKVFID
jgi:hypothetical protein